jgi:hypothetical protein
MRRAGELKANNPETPATRLTEVELPYCAIAV